MNSAKDIWGGNYMHPNINAIDTILKVHDPISQAQSEWKVAELFCSTKQRQISTLSIN